MSLKSREARKLAVAGFVAAAALTGATSAQAAVPTVPNATLQYDCKYPLVDVQPLSIEISSNIPSKAEIDVKQPAFQITATASAGGDTAEAITTLDAAFLDGQAGSTASLVFPSGFVQKNLKVPLTVDRWTRPNPLTSPLVLTAKGQTPAVTLDELGPVKVNVDTISLNLSAYYADGSPIDVKKLKTDINGAAVTDSDGKWETFDVYCKIKDGTSNTIATIDVVEDIDGGGGGNDPVAPSVVTGLKADSKDQTSVSLSWAASTDANAGDTVSYKVLRNGVQVGSTQPGTTFKDTGLTKNTEYTYTVIATDGTLDAAASAALKVKTDGDVVVPNTPPTAPTNVKTTSVAANSVGLSWTASTDDKAVTGYRVIRNGTTVGTVTGTSYTDSSVAASTTYSYVIEAFDAENAATKSSPALSVTTPVGGTTPTCPQGLACYNYDLKGSTSLKTLTQGNLPLTGGIKAQLKVSDGTFNADLTLNNTNGRLVAGGFLPITAKVGFVPIGKTTGVLEDATATKPQSITTKSIVRIKVLEVKLFGAIPLAGGNNCQTKTPSEINLASTNEFDPFKGGTIAGTYKISDLNGCGVLNGIVSPLTAGGGNTISLNLVRK